MWNNFWTPLCLTFLGLVLVAYWFSKTQTWENWKSFVVTELIKGWRSK